ncbi:glutamate--tRNA ligase [Spiribacter vilamensis]|uniref:Glutamate--tRNA ligase n=1 Tax=Spiribacter vilamensis TaxID=531306 RepID=A0A4Q8CYM8_9GAMM|nr:glutamate--tRNA ligase [Spiribacter vilamensis]RZU98000.1 glutamyl-tRNA synthetase /glutamate--tRNA(Gln) ligase [Spiribacter vilamensis]TVO61091.1 glutamate--tRNA ligase [Spiribacter vilamensis]
MNDKVVRTRFAPSPSGRLHIGNLRTALFNRLLARHHQGVFMLRVEDSDAARSDATAIDGLQSDLRWLGLAWDAGPGIDDPEDWQQSRRAALHADAAERLRTADAAYPCFCSIERLAALRDRQQRAGEPPRYDGRCAGIDPAEAARRVAAGEPSVLRLRMPADGVIGFTDRLRGEQSFPAADLDDPVIQRADGSPAFLFANALDDALMGITHVLRGEDHLSNTPRQLVLLERLGLDAPCYGHLSLVVDERDAPLSKRRGAPGIDDLRDRGVLPEAICNYLARLGNPVPDETLQTLDQLAAGFDVSRLSRRPARFDERQLRHWQSLAMARAPLETLRPALQASCIPHELIPAFIALVQPNLQSAGELNDWAVRLFDDRDVMTDATRARATEVGPEFFETVLTMLESADTSDWKALRAQLEEATGRRGGALMKPLRQVLTGLDHGPALGAIIHIMPAAIRRLRLQRAAAVASGAGSDA